MKPPKSNKPAKPTDQPELSDEDLDKLMAALKAIREGHNDKAILLLEGFADSTNNADVHTHLANVYLRENNASAAITNLEKAADLADLNATLQLIELLEKTVRAGGDSQKYLKWLNVGVERQYPHAIYLLATLMYEGKWVTQESQAAINLFEDAASLNYVEAMITLAKIYLTDEYDDVNKAVYWCKTVPKNSHKGFMLLAPIYGSKLNDSVSEVNCYKEAAKLGNLEAQLILGEKYFHSDKNQAIEWYLMAAKQGQQEAEYKLSQLYQQNFYTQSEYFEWLETAAQSGYPQATFELSQLYQNGLAGIVTKDQEEAFKWCERAVALGNKNAIRILAQMYLDGHGVVQNQFKAIQLLIMSFDHSAALLLGQMHYDKDNDAFDVTAGIEWYEKAAEQNIIAA